MTHGEAVQPSSADTTAPPERGVFANRTLNLRSMQAIGYRHMAPVVAGSQTLQLALEAMKRDTRRFARRQRTWFRGVREAVWSEPEPRDALHRRVEGFLAQATAPHSAML